MTITINPDSIASAEAIGSPVLGSNLIKPGSIESGEEFGIPTLTRSTGGSSIDYYRQTGNSEQPLFDLLPPRDLEPIPTSANNPDINSPEFRSWFERLDTRVREENQIHANQIQLGTLHLADLGSRRHSDLTDVFGGGPGGDAQHWTTQEKKDELVRHWITLEG